MTPEAQRIHDAIDVLSDRVTDMQGELQGDMARTEAVVRAAVADGIRDVLSDEKVVAQFWRAALTQVQDHAQREAGGLMFSGLRKMMTIAALLFVAYAVGGSALVAKAWHWATTT